MSGKKKTISKCTKSDNSRRLLQSWITHAQPPCGTLSNSGFNIEAEPRRSVRATKGQHTKSFDELEQPAPKRRQTKKTRKALEQEELEQSQEPDEIIRCVCGATEQDEDSGEAWISCETCFAWQHNVCVGVSSFEDEIPENYWCEQCRPQDHKELLEAMERGEHLWDDRRKAHEEEVVNRKKRGGKKGRGKRVSDPKEETEKEATRSKSTKASPTPDAPSGKPGSKQGKRKSRDDSHEADGKTPKLRRVSHHEAVPVPAKYTPPPDLAAVMSDLTGTRLGPAKALKKSLAHVATLMEKNGEVEIPENSSIDSIAETYALQIERAVYDTHPIGKGQKEYAQQIKSLTFNLKNNSELFEGLLQGTHTPSTLAVMTSEQLASSEMQKQTAEMKAKAEKQSILYTQDTGPRVRRTHKGEEVVEDESNVNNISDAPIPRAGGPPRHKPTDTTTSSTTPPAIKQEHSSGGDQDLPRRSPSQAEGQQSPSQSNFDISKVFSKVKSPTATQRRRPSGPAINTSGPGFDPEVDRMLEDETESPPYSPTEESQDPDVVWRGSLAMSSIADFQATGKHVGGANFASFGSWSKLIPNRMTVAGRITQQNAIEYLCSLRYSSLTDIVVVALTPASPEAQPEFKALVDYFVSKGRYGVVGNKVAGNVRDTYLVPVPAGEDGHPEFMLNLVDNFIPKTRTEDMLLAVFVYRNEPDQLRLSEEARGMGASPLDQAPNLPGSRSSISGPAMSPATPQAPQPTNGLHHTTTSLPQHPAQPQAPLHPTPPQHGAAAAAGSEAQMYQRQQEGEKLARDILGAFITAPTAQFLLPQAFQMKAREWEAVRAVYERDPKARDDLKHLSMLLEKQPPQAGPPPSAPTATPTHAQ